MKIGQPNDPSVAISSNNQSAAAKAGAELANAARSERKAPSASVTVSALARGLDKTGAMRQAIADKTYTVNPGAIADKLLANAREMLQRTTS